MGGERIEVGLICVMKTAAVIGASNDRSRYGNKAVRAFRRAGYEVFPVNPTEAEIEGLKVYASVSQIPGSLDTITIYVRPAVLVKLLPEIAAKGCRELWLNPGTSSETVLAEVQRLGLNAIEGCSILAIGQSPYALD
jgi:predicted CoA-binding protein